MGKHTPGPWSVGTGLRTSAGKGIGFIAEIKTLPNRDYQQMEANADFIVRACNSHDELLEALKECLKAVNTVIAFSDMAGHESLSFIRVKKMAEQAIAKAEGEK